MMGNSLMAIAHPFLVQELLCLSSNWLDRYGTAVFATTLEHNYAVNESVQCVILTDTYILAWVVLSTTLTNDNVASLHCLSTEVLQTESFRV